MATNYALDPTGLAQVLIETTSGQSTHYLPGLAQYGGNAWSYYLPDRLGSVRQLTDPSGAVMLARSYDPFGNGLEQVGGGQSVFGYTGEQTDPTGLVFLRARYYSPYLNRFISPDTIIPNPTQSQSWNRYLYTGNNPVNRADPSGHCIGILLGADTLICAEVVVAGAVIVAGGIYIATSPTYQNALHGVINSSSLSMLPGYGMFGPGANSQPTEGFNLLDEAINQCYQPGSNVGRPDPWQLPPLNLGVPPLFGPTTPGFSTNPIPLPNTWTAQGDNWRSGKRLTTNRRQIMKVLGLSDLEFNKAIHNIKSQIEGNPDVETDLNTGNVYDPRSGEWIGNLLDELY
ncbi:MAG: RHS repeat-associated core domain-containing protein [Anaerolineae bacterium]|nr:RHS repeat-associated core domain-containing protein [Anaerolineae bacterium]